MTFEKALSLIKNDVGILTRNTKEWKNKYIMLYEVFSKYNTTKGYRQGTYSRKQQIIQFDVNRLDYIMYIPSNDDMFANDWLEKDDADKITEIMNDVITKAKLERFR